MITGFKNITSENPIKEIWKFLRFFLDVPSVSEKIRRMHNIQGKKYVSDIKKQAKQIGYCIRQAEQYFEASSEVGLATRPTLLYYGAVSLSRALVLFRRHGNYSFDALRKGNKHNHHGLDLERGLINNVRSCDDLVVFFNSLQCGLHTNEKNIPWGNFALFYESLVPCSFQITTTAHKIGETATLSHYRSHPCADLLPLKLLISKQFNVMELMKTLPDMYFFIKELGVKANLCEGNLKHWVVQFHKKDEQGNEKIEKIKEEFSFTLDGILPDQKSLLLDYYRQKNPLINPGVDFGGNILLELTVEYSPGEEHLFYLPDIVDDIIGQKFYILRPEDYLPEPAVHLIQLFCLGMLSRYYPDIWMKAIDENVRIAELTDSLLNVIFRKFPNLILDQMTWIKHYVHK